MMDLRDALHEATPTYDLTEPDIATLQRRADRGRRSRRAAAVATVVAALGVVGAVAATVFGAGQPTQVDIVDQAPPASIPQSFPSPSASVPAAERDDYEAWRDFQLKNRDVMLEGATASQRAALEDGSVTEQEWLAAARAWQSCVRDGGYDTFELRLVGQLPGAAPFWSYETPSAQREYLEDRDEVVMTCLNTHFASVNALWQDQETHYPTLWNSLQRFEELGPSGIPSDVGGLTSERLDDQ